MRGFVTGIGGVFIKSKDPKNLASWYKEHFNLPFQGPYCVIGWKDENNKEAEGSTVFSFFKEDTDYFNPSRSEFMINFRVNDLEKALSELRSNQVEVMEKSEDYDYGKFGWFVDPVGNKVELWQPK
ncbi:MAG: VOC family protein [Bacteroidetes bacterium]|nr:MAG: VOC family protein [Bacteroidota bacterium]REK00071.1 MAG: VOC family protein [Bacteroidota bacterium]REK35925.1 MAG: VOC family protein [Bacteroidota bacterium]REK50701.1 MAG: VOC family protein [Bacteroidota bacterium]